MSNYLGAPDFRPDVSYSLFVCVHYIVAVGIHVLECFFTVKWTRSEQRLSRKKFPSMRGEKSDQ